jgi:hypothetical protein
MDDAILLFGAQPQPPPIPTRHEILSAPWLFQGVTVVTAQYGRLPWFDIFIGSLQPLDRQSVYRTLDAVGSKCLGTAISYAYLEPGQPYNDLPGRDFTANLPMFCDLLWEIIRAGKFPYVFLAGDGQSNPNGGYNDPVGHTLGYQWLMTNLPRILAAFDVAGLRKRIVCVPGFDGVFYGWQPEQVKAFGQLFRSLWPDGYLVIEHNTGHIPCGEGGADYAPGGLMRTFDGVLSEFDWPIGQDSTWQIVARLVSPYHRPPDQPTWDDPHAPFYLAPGTDRGPYVYRAFEFELYRWVRDMVSLKDIEATRAYLVRLGAAVTG